MTGKIIETNTEANDKGITFTNEVPPPPNYKEWFNKPCWFENEIIYLAQGIDPDRPMTVCDIPENECEMVVCKPEPKNIEIEQRADQLKDLLRRAKEAGELQPTPGGEGFKPRDIITCLQNAHLPDGVTLPTELLTILKEKVKPKAQNEINNDWQSRMEVIAAKLKKEGKESQAKKGKLAGQLAKETGENAATIERNTRKTW